MEIIDAQVGLRYPGERFPDDERRFETTFQSKLDVLRAAGISRAVAGRNEWVGGISCVELLFRNRMIAEACQASEGMLIPSASINPCFGELACDLMRQCRKELGMRLVGEMFDTSLGFQWGTPEYYQVLACAVELRMIPLIHCENEVIAELGERYPEGQFLVMHLYSGKVRDHRPRLVALAPYPNLSLVISGTPIGIAGAIRDAVRMLGADRVVFGTDHPSIDPVIAVMMVRRSGISEEDQAKVFAGNFNRLWEWTDV